MLLAVAGLVALCSLGAASPAQAQRTHVAVASVPGGTALLGTAAIATDPHPHPVAEPLPRPAPPAQAA